MIYNYFNVIQQLCVKGERYMSTMTNYLRDVAMLEGQLYTQNWIISTLQKRINALGIANVYQTPVWHPWVFELIGDSSFILGPVTGISLVYEIFTEVFFGDWSLLAIGRDVLKTVLIAAIIEVTLRNIYTYFNHNTSHRRKYNQELKNYNSAVDADNRRVQHELVLKQKLETHLQQVKREKNSTERVLTSLYSIGVIHPKYQHNMIAVSSFFDYFDTGRCLAFKGPGGAYATYEEDLRFQRLETKLDVIISKLDELIANQRTLAKLMRDANNTLYRIEQSNNRMMQNMSRIEQNTELIEYNSRCAMESSVVMENIMVYNTLKNN